MNDDRFRLPAGKNVRRRAAGKPEQRWSQRSTLPTFRPPPPPPPTGSWGPDVLGPGFVAQTFDQPDDGEGSVVTTLVHYQPDGSAPPRPAMAVLYVHGWGDYFMQTELAEFWHQRSAVFYAVDLRKCGRSIRQHQTRCYVASLSEYDADLQLAIDTIRREHGSDIPIVAVAHSQGGLTTSLWAARNPEVFSGLVLNSPFLEVHGSTLARQVSHPVISQVARHQARLPIPIPAPTFYDRVVNSQFGGEWTLEPSWRPDVDSPIRPGWLDAVMAGHARVAAGLDLQIPILVLTSHRTVISSRWREDMRGADIVLDVKQLWRRIPDLGAMVTLAKIHNGLHDVLLSAPQVRAQAYAQIDRWWRGYGP
ncbi:MAG: alpha/beta hydrolase [Beutenbergiaceae bacterium]